MLGLKMIRDMLKKLEIKKVPARVWSLVISNWELYLAVSAYIIVLSTITILKHHAFLSSGFDLGVYNQAFATTLHNQKFFYTTTDLSFNPGGSFFGTHFSPMLFLLLPFYALYPGVENLLVMQSAILAIGAFPVYWMSRDKIGKEAGLMISVVYLVYPPLILLNLNDFHLEAFTATFFLFGVYYFEREEWGKSFSFIILAMLTLEFAPITGVLVALYGLWLYSKKKFKNKRGARKYIVLTALLSISVFFLAYIAKLYFNPYTSPLPSPFHYLLSNPAAMLEMIFVDFEWKIFYAINYLAPLAFLPLLAPGPLIMALPWIGFSYISTYAAYYSVYYQYTGFVIPFVFVALPKAIERLNHQNARKIFAVTLLSTILFLLFLPFGPGSPWNYQLPVTNERTELIEKILPLIPSNASILTQNDIFPHVSSRMNAYMYLPRSSNTTVDYVFVDVNSIWFDWQQLPLFGERIPPSQLTYDGLANGTYGILASASSLLLLKKGYTGKPALFAPFDSRHNYENLYIRYGSTVSDPNSTSGEVLYHGEEQQTGDFWYGPYVSLLPGLYRVTYVTKVNGPDEIIKNENKTLFTVDVAYETGNRYLKEITNVNGSSALSAGQWFNSTLFFSTKIPVRGVEFRGHVPDNQSVSVCLDYLIVEQLYDATFNYEDLTVGQGNISNGIITHVKGAGTFWYGPYTIFPKGNYAAKFWLKQDKPYHGPLMDIDAASNYGKKLASLTVHSSNFEKIDKWQSFDVKFTLQDEFSIMEFRGMNVRETAPISLLSIEVYPDTGQPQQPIYKTTYNYKDLTLGQGNVSNGIITHLKGNGTFWSGPHASLTKGNYTAQFWLKLDKPYDGSLLDIDASTDYGKKLASLTVHSSNFEKIDKWQSFDVKFTLQDEFSIMEFRGMNVRETAPISLLSIEVYPDTGQPQQPIYKTTYNYKDLTLGQGNVSNGIITHLKGNGTFWSGPYTTLPKGNYTAQFWLKLDKPYNGPLLNIDVSTDLGKRVLASLMISSLDLRRIDAWRSFEVKFTIQEDWGNYVEFRGMNVREKAPISLLSIEVYPDTGQPQQPIYKTTYNYKDLTIGQGNVSNGIITHLKGNGTFWSGPYTTLPKGNYTAKFWLKLDKPYNGSLLDIDVSVDLGKKVLASLMISDSDFETTNTWESFEVKFTIQEDWGNYVEFRGMNVRETAPISLLSIEVYPDTGQPQQPIYKTTYNYKDLTLGQGNVSNGIITHLKGNGTFWYGPNTSLKKGNYTAQFWLKLDQPYNGPLLDIDVSTELGKKVLASLVISDSDFETINTWRSFGVKFTIQEDWSNHVELRGMNVRETAPVSCLLVEVSEY